MIHVAVVTLQVLNADVVNTHLVIRCSWSVAAAQVFCCQAYWTRLNFTLNSLASLEVAAPTPTCIRLPCKISQLFCYQGDQCEYHH